MDEAPGVAAYDRGVRLSQIVVYPIKSGAGISAQQWPLLDRGLAHDRSFMVVDAATGSFLTQRECPALALVRPVIVIDEAPSVIDEAPSVVGEPSADETPTADGAAKAGPTPMAGGTLDVVVGGDQVTVPLQLPPHSPVVSVSVWEHDGPALDAGDQVADLLSTHLGRAVRMVGLAPDHQRAADANFAPRTAPVSFTDGFPLLITAESSLADLNDRLPEALPMNRFRPNLVITDSQSYAEDGWSSIKVGDVDIDLVKPCARCAITTVDQQTGVRSGGEPLRALATYRRGERGVLFGQNAVHRTNGTLRVGDAVTAVRSEASLWSPTP